MLDALLGLFVFAGAEPATVTPDDTTGYHPDFRAPSGPPTVDLALHPDPEPRTGGWTQHDLSVLDHYRIHPPPPDPSREHTGLPQGWVQRGDVVLPQAVADGLTQVDPRPMAGVEDIPGNKYPRKHTLYLNFLGGMLYVGSDNSALDKSSLAKQGVYPAYTGGEAKAAAAAQGVANDVAAYGIRVVYQQRPPQLLPYTMAMIGGHWTDTNLDSSAGGVASTVDCGALGQRHVVYTFADASWSSTAIANVTSQEAGHAWGLDHNLNCNSVMAYCGGGDKGFSSTCDGLCEQQCQGAAVCRLTHEMFCGVGNDQQNEHAELSWVFGGNEPDLEPPYVEIVEPPDDEFELPIGSSLPLRAVVDDNYGGFAWRLIVTRDGVVEYDEIDYKKDVDAMYRPGLNLTNLDEGTYSFTVEVLDHADHLSTDTVTFYVVKEMSDDGGTTADPDTGSDTASGDSSSDGGSTDEGTAGPADPTLEPAPETSGPTSATDTDGTHENVDEGTGGCTCRATSPNPTWGWVLLLAGTSMLRRRRGAGSSSSSQPRTW